MKKDTKLISIILVASLLACNNSENFPVEDNYQIGIKVNILNYTDEEFPEGTMIYLGAIEKDTFIAVDSIQVKQKILASKSDPNSDSSILTIPENDSDRLNLNLWDIDLEDVKKISKNGGILIRFADKHFEIVCDRFVFDENGVYNSFLIRLNLTVDDIGYYSIDTKIEKSNLFIRKNSSLIFKQLIN